MAGANSPGFFITADGIVVVRAKRGQGLARLLVASVAVLAAGVYATVVAIDPGAVDLPRKRFWTLVGAGLFLAAAMHLYLVFTAVRRPAAVITKQTIRLPANRIARSAIKKCYIDQSIQSARNPMPALMAVVSDGPREYVVTIIPSGYLGRVDMFAVIRHMNARD